jgi:16S rRNA (cytosine1402-N4)-methyltransferase
LNTDKMQHKPVMLAEALEQMQLKKDGVYLDCTFGRGGHSRGILAELSGAGQLLALDRDHAAVHSEEARLMCEDPRFKLAHRRFSELEAVASQEGLLGHVDGILMDLGVSSPQLDTPERGFSFLRDGPLDMRMDDTSGISAQQWLAEVDEKELVRVLFEYGEERFAKRIARAVMERRVVSPITDTRQLAALIADAVPFIDKYKHPATRTFQAIRIEVNRELEELKEVLRQSIQVLKPGGRVVVISFHSLEDRIVKRFIRDEAGAKFDPGKLPIKEVDIARGALIKIGKAIKAGKTELSENPRSRSAVMRTAERVIV